MAARKPKLPNLNISSLCEGLVARDQGVMATFNAHATDDERAAYRQASHDVNMYTLAEMGATTRVEARLAGGNLTDSLMHRAEIMAGVLVRAQGDMARAWLTHTFAAALRQKSFAG